MSHSIFEPCFNTASGGQELWQGKDVVRQRVLEDERDRSPFVAMAAIVALSSHGSKVAVRCQAGRKLLAQMDPERKTKAGSKDLR